MDYLSLVPEAVASLHWGRDNILNSDYFPIFAHFYNYPSSAILLLVVSERENKYLKDHIIY